MDNAAAVEAIRRRFSCRAYEPARPLEEREVAQLQELVDEADAEPGIHFQLVGPEQGAGEVVLAESLFRNAPSHYLALVALDSARMQEQAGYLGEKFVLLATSLGLGTCWVMGSFERDSARYEVAEGEKLLGIILVGHPMRIQPLRQRSIRRGLRKSNRDMKELYEGPVRLNRAPLWIQAGVGAMWAAPSAQNEQPVVIRQAIKDAPVSASLDQERLKTDHGMVDLGIAKLHFEVGAHAQEMNGTWQWGDGGSFLPA